MAGGSGSGGIGLNGGRWGKQEGRGGRPCRPQRLARVVAPSSSSSSSSGYGLGIWMPAKYHLLPLSAYELSSVGVQKPEESQCVPPEYKSQPKQYTYLCFFKTQSTGSSFMQLI
ncbi:hypothetical protein SETIT_2G398800v2 [Setaria italica]|uniref:Uncharacterized protein n=1 Tax=Setaria italica TaxID=4555 RepID=A0A368Q7U6_SETIT|nr:hypothetical protein SETIT_2G398800v2 [Setaria italica]